ncbi:MAG: winged helix-turn-helix transcriptional regulator [Verrucomicrobia bacterium]|nr:winged helix-turn-helix transcriptional regulator [Verrucomicrobiota bacterium]
MTLREQAAVFKALGHPVRLAMVRRLARGECCVCELLGLSEVASVSGPTVSQHLLVLKNAGVIRDERRGQKIFYRLLLPCVAEISFCVQQQTTRAMEVTV